MELKKMKEVLYACFKSEKSPKSSMPTLAIGEIAVTTDTFELFVGSSGGNRLVGENTFLKLSGGTLTGALTLSGDPTQPLHAVTKQYVDNLLVGLKWKAPVKVATTGSISLSGTQTIDGINVSVGDRVLVKDQISAAQNGIYIVQTGTWIRAEDANSWDELVSAAVFVMQGNTNGDKGFVCTVDPGGTLGTTDVSWSLFTGGVSYTFGNGLQLNGNTVSLKVNLTDFSFAGDGTLQLNIVDGGTW